MCRSYLFAGITLVVTAILPGCGKSPQQLVARGNELLAKGQVEDALLDFHKALQREPKRGEAYHGIGLANIKVGNGSEAYFALNEAVQLMPSNLTAKKDLLDLCLDTYLGDPQHPKFLYDRLSSVSDDLLRLEPGSATGWRVKGYLRLSDRRPPEALDFLSRSDRSKPGDARTVRGLVQAYFENQQLAEAEKTALAFLEKDRSDTSMYESLYRFYLVTQRPAEAEGVLVRRTKDRPADSTAFLALAAYYGREKKTGEQEAVLQQVLGKPVDFPRGRLEVGDFYAFSGDLARAAELYRAGGAARSKDAAVYQNRLARILVLENKRPEAVEVLEGILRGSARDKDAQALRSALLLEDATPEKRAEGLRRFEALAKQNPADDLLRLAYARAALQQSDLSAARTELTALAKRRPDIVLVPLSLAEIAVRQNQPEQVLTHAAATLRIDPRNPAAQLLQAGALAGSGRLGEARLILNRMTASAPDVPAVYIQLGQLDLREKKYAAAETDYRKALQLASRNVTAVQGLVEVYLAKRQPEKALTLLQQHEDGAEVRALLAATAVRAGKLDLAAETYRQITNEQPKAVDPRLQLAQVSIMKGDTEGALAVLREAAQIDPKDPRPTALQAALLGVTNRKDEAVQASRRALAIRPGDPAVMNNLAYVLAESGDNLDEALSLAQQAVSRSPSQPDYLDTLGLVYLKQRKYDASVHMFGRLANQHAQVPAFTYHLALALYESGDKSGAKTQLQRALERRPSPELQKLIRDLRARIQ